MKTIWKFELPDADCKVKMPIGAEIVKVEAQNGVPCMWAIVDTEAKEVRM